MSQSFPPLNMEHLLVDDETENTLQDGVSLHSLAQLIFTRRPVPETIVSLSESLIIPPPECAVPYCLNDVVLKGSSAIYACTKIFKITNKYMFISDKNSKRNLVENV